MESKLVKLKTDFNNIINVRTTVKNIFDILQIRIDKLKILYAEFIKTSKNQMFVFGLDSFHFQSKLIDIEYDDMKRLFLAINNRMYCEYFKLYKIIIDYISSNITDKKITDIVKINSYPIYKDLEPFKEYNFEIILDIHENILNLLGIIISTLNNKENELLLHKNKQRIGLNIDNFITTFNYNIIVMREKIIMFITYIEFFHKLHTKYLKRFANKIQLMYSHINNDIQFDESLEVSKKHNTDDSESLNYENDSNSQRSSSNREKIENSGLQVEIDNDNNTTNSDISSNSTQFENLDLGTIAQYNDNISERSRTDSMLSNNATPKFKLKNIVNTMNNLMIFSNTKEEPKNIEEKLSHDDLNNMFFTINMSCDSIINNKKENTDTEIIDTEIIDTNTNSEIIETNTNSEIIETDTNININTAIIENIIVNEIFPEPVSEIENKLPESTSENVSL